MCSNIWATHVDDNGERIRVYITGENPPAEFASQLYMTVGNWMYSNPDRRATHVDVVRRNGVTVEVHVWYQRPEPSAEPLSHRNDDTNSSARYHLCWELGEQSG